MLYYRCLRDVLDLVDRWPVDQAARERAYLHWFDSTVLARFGPGGFRTWPADFQPRFFAEARAVTAERFPRHLEALLTPAFRVRAALLRSGDMTGLIAYSAAERHVTTRPRILTTSWTGHTLSLSVSAMLEVAAHPVRFDRSGSAVRQRPSAELDAQLRRSALEVLDVTTALSGSRADLMITHRETNAEWLLPGQASTRLVPDGDAQGLRVDVYAHLDVDHALMGAPLGPGVWDLRLRLTALGYDSRPTIRIDPEQVPPELTLAGGSVKPYRTKNGRLALTRRS